LINKSNRSIKPPGGESGRDGEASTFLAEGAQAQQKQQRVKHLVDHSYKSFSDRIDQTAAIAGPKDGELFHIGVDCRKAFCLGGIYSK